jgi:hypothetical protein
MSLHYILIFTRMPLKSLKMFNFYNNKIGSALLYTVLNLKKGTVCFKNKAIPKRIERYSYNVIIVRGKLIGVLRPSASPFKSSTDYKIILFLAFFKNSITLMLLQ